ncbi:MAG: hypothetical protein IJP92_07365 [Lachnospiraceae bacterium]|nr:hypothetical protein [Lachnospiraceae bacterium]
MVAHLEKRYGSEKTKAIMAKALKRYDEIVEENRDEPKVYHMHTFISKAGDTGACPVWSG